jgi:multicomponent Na+:H+ antiporter subunit G
MSLAIDVFTVACVLSGVFFFLASAVALLRFPDTLTRLHATTKADSLGLGLVVLGLLPRSDWLFAALKPCVVWLLAQVAGATFSQLVARAVQGKSRSA